MGNWQRWHCVVLATALGGVGVSCGGGARDTLPAGWEGASTLTTQQTACNGDTMSADPGLELSEAAGVIAGTYKDAEFRCSQQVCAYVLDTSATTRVLIQPCDLHPTSVPKCDCLYDVTFTLPARADRTAVELYRRVDFYGATSPPTPALVATHAVGVSASI